MPPSARSQSLWRSIYAIGSGFPTEKQPRSSGSFSASSLFRPPIRPATPNIYMIWIKTKFNLVRRAPIRKRNHTRQVGLIITEETYKELIEKTNKEEVTVSEWIRQAIETKLEANYSREKDQRRFKEEERL